MALSQKYEVLETRLLSDNWGIVKTTKLRMTLADGSTTDQWRETYDRGDGAVILPFDPLRNHVLLGRQFRWSAAYRGDENPLIIEAAAGMLDNASAQDRIVEEAQEELGLTLSTPRFLFDIYMSPGSVSEKLHFFVAEYSAEDATETMGGLRDEGEEIEILDLPLAEAMEMIKDGRIQDAKTIILLQYAALNLTQDTIK